MAAVSSSPTSVLVAVPAFTCLSVRTWKQVGVGYRAEPCLPVLMVLHINIRLKHILMSQHVPVCSQCCACRDCGTGDHAVLQGKQRQASIWEFVVALLLYALSCACAPCTPDCVGPLPRHALLTRVTWP